MVGCPSGQEGGVHAGAVGDSTGGATHAQSAWPHANGHNLVNIRAILLIFCVVGFSISRATKSCCHLFLARLGYLVAPVSLGV